jgi:DNA-binding transcriptional MerR regulator
VHRLAVPPHGAGEGEPAFRSIGEAAADLGLKPHVLRYWETRFSQLRPMKRPDGRRYYRPEDMILLRRLQELLHVRGLTLKGAALVLDEESAPAASAGAGTDATSTAPEQAGDAGLAAAARLGRSVGELQAMVREAVARGEFGGAALSDNEAARDRLETLLSGLSRLKTRMDSVRKSDAA